MVLLLSVVLASNVTCSYRTVRLMSLFLLLFLKVMIVMPKKNSDIVFSLRVPDELYARLKYISKVEDRSLNYLILQILRPAVQAWEEKDCPPREDD